VSFGAYSLWTIGWGLLTLRECPEAYEELIKVNFSSFLLGGPSWHTADPAFQSHINRTIYPYSFFFSLGDRGSKKRLENERSNGRLRPSLLCQVLCSRVDFYVQFWDLMHELFDPFPPFWT